MSLGGWPPSLVAVMVLTLFAVVILAFAGRLTGRPGAVVALSVAVVTALGRGARPLEAAFKYFVLAAVSLATLIYGIGLYVLATGSLSLAAARPTDPTLQFLYAAALVLVALGFAFELAAAP